MKHSDKNQEFDNMFKNAFEGLEMEPSERVWMGVERELDKNRKGVVLTWVARLSIAASIVLVCTVGLYQMNFFGNENATRSSVNTADASKNNASKELDTVKERKLEKISKPMQPISEEPRLVDVVEIKSRSTRSSKNVKKAVSLNSSNKNINRTQDEKDAIELLKKLEEKAEINNKVAPVSESGIKKPIVTKPVTPVPSPSVASNTGSKTEIGVVEMLNYVAKKVSGDEATKLVAINENKTHDGSVRKKYQVDLGIVKFTRTKNSR